jgi:hypothetical protein
MLRRALTLTIALVALGCSDADEHRAEFVPGTTTTCPVLTRSGRCRAIRDAEVDVMATGGDMYLPGAGFALAGTGFLAVGVGFRSSKLVAMRSGRYRLEELPFLHATAATGVVGPESSSLYFLSSGRLHVARIQGGEIGTPTTVDLRGGAVAPWWPQTVALEDGRVLLAYVDPQRSVLYGVSDKKGTTFQVKELDVDEDDLRGTLAHVGVTAEGTWILTYQVADENWTYRSGVLFSRNEGANWVRAPFPEGDIAAVFPIRRRDTGADLYYVVHEAHWNWLGTKEQEWSVRRRALHDDGSLGPEQAVTSVDLGRVANPQPRRMVDGRVALMFSILKNKDERDLAIATVDGDAPY